MQTDVIVTEDVQDVRDYLLMSPTVAVDIETTSLTCGKGDLLCVAMARVGGGEPLVWWPKDPSELRGLHFWQGVFHNAAFDARWLRHYGAEVGVVWDTMIMAHLLEEEQPAGLKALGQRLLGYPDWSEDSIEDLSSLPRERVTAYAATDVLVTRELFEWQRSKLTDGSLAKGDNPLRVMRDIILPVLPPLESMETYGLPVRRSAMRRELAEVEREIANVEAELDAMIPPREVWPEWLQKTQPKWGNTTWTKWWLYEHQGAPVIRRGKPTKTWPDGNPSLASDVLSQIDHPAAKMLTRLAGLNKLHSAFLIPLYTRAVNGKVPTAFRVTGTVTGRLSSASPGADNPGINSQQIPRDKRIRNLFGERGKAWIEADYSQLELRVAAVLAGEDTMINLFNRGEDIHTYMARQLTGSDTPTKEQRSLAKAVNFGFLYGMQAKQFRNYLQSTFGMSITGEEAEEFREGYFRTFSKLPEWYERQKKTCIERGGVPNAFGRFRHLPNAKSTDFWQRESAFRQAINAPVQSTGSDFMLISLARIYRSEQLREWGAQLVTTVHDSVELVAPPGNIKRIAREIKRIMESADDRLDRRFLLKADVTVSKCWGGEPLWEL